MTLEALKSEVEALRRTVADLSAESDIRRIVARYMFLCDIPYPDAADASTRVKAICDLYSDDAVWEGVGSYYDNQFGRSVGRAELEKHFEKFFQPREPEMILNCHYLTSEQIHVTGDTATGQWVHFQPWIFSDGSSLIRGSRMNNAFKKVDGVWKMSRYRTENVFVGPLPKGWSENIPTEMVLMKV
jgi:ketosteroid isomerase-like protein